MLIFIYFAAFVVVDAWFDFKHSQASSVFFPLLFYVMVKVKAYWRGE